MPDSPVAGLLCSIFVPVLGLQGFLINARERGAAAKAQRVISIIILVLFVLVLGLIGTVRATTTKTTTTTTTNTTTTTTRESNEEVERKARTAIGSFLGVMAAGGLLSILCFVSLILAIVILANDKR